MNSVTIGSENESRIDEVRPVFEPTHTGMSIKRYYLNWYKQSTWKSDTRIYYRKNSSISRTLVGNKIIDNSDVVGASPVGAAPTTSSFST